MLIVHDEGGNTVFDGNTGICEDDLTIQVLDEGSNSDVASVFVRASEDEWLTVFVTSWHVLEGDFIPFLPQSSEYSLSAHADCESTLLSPPNFNPDNVVDGYYLMPESEPSGLYTRKADACSRGTRVLIDVLYTVAFHWKELWPSLAPIGIRDMNAHPSCSTVQHQTHDDGTHVDIVVSCATSISCSNKQPAIDLAKLFIDTGHACGIIFNDTAVQDEVNAYFESRFEYQPWHGTFMRSVSGHDNHFHVRVMKPDGTCN